MTHIYQPIIVIGEKFSTTFIPSQGWTRLGWKKSHKLANLPDFFAITEATALLYASGHE